MFGLSSGPQHRTQPAKLEIPFGHAFDRREVSSSKSAVRAGILSVCDSFPRRCEFDEHAFGSDVSLLVGFDNLARPRDRCSDIERQV